MEITRKLTTPEKNRIRIFCERVVQEHVNSHKFFEIDRTGKVDLIRVENLTNLKFKQEDYDKCLEWFQIEEMKDDQDALPDDELPEGGFHTYYTRMLKLVLTDTKKPI